MFSTWRRWVIAFMVFAALIGGIGVIVLQSIRTMGVTKQQAGVLQPFASVPMTLALAPVGQRAAHRSDCGVRCWRFSG